MRKKKGLQSERALVLQLVASMVSEWEEARSALELGARLAVSWVKGCLVPVWRH